jgi:hypothetical protein
MVMHGQKASRTTGYASTRYIRRSTRPPETLLGYQKRTIRLSERLWERTNICLEHYLAEPKMLSVSCYDSHSNDTD